MAGYNGQIAVIPFGDGALQTDDPNTKVMPTRLITAKNVSIHQGLVEKEGGSRRWNSTALPSGVVQFLDYWPSPILQRIIAVGRDGKVYRLPNYYTQAEVTPSGSAPPILSVQNYVTMLAGGQEEAGNERKVFIFTGNNPIQVITGDGSTRRDITNPAVDWAGTNQPFAGVVHRTRLFAWGNQNDRHRVYLSASGDHEDFTSAPRSHSIYPGEGERIVMGFVYREKLFVMKYPQGLYVFDDSSADPDEWGFIKSTASFGALSPNGFAMPFDDVLIGNEYGSISSLQSANTFGDLLSADVFNVLRVQSMGENELLAEGFNNRQAVYYKAKKTVMFTFQSPGNSKNDRIVNLLYRSAQELHVTLTTKDQPNCLVLKKDQNRKERPAYGADDGFIYEMDQPDRWVGDATGATADAYTFEVQTPHMDLGALGPQISELEKQFDFLDVVFKPTGKWDVLIDVFIDGKFIKTLRCDLSSGSELDASKLDDRSIADATVEQSRQFPLQCSGRRISLRCYNETAGQNVKLVALKIYCTIASMRVESKGKG